MTQETLTIRKMDLKMYKVYFTATGELAWEGKAESPELACTAADEDIGYTASVYEEIDDVRNVNDAGYTVEEIATVGDYRAVSGEITELYN